jgi:hypothetical protein
MHFRRALLVIVIFAPSLISCNLPSGSQTRSVQAAQPPITTQKTIPGTSPNRSATAIPVTTDGGAAADDIPTTCAVTRPSPPLFRPPAPYSRYAPSPDEFWHGTDALWTAVPSNGVWSGLPHNPEGYTQKVFWWRKGYSWTEEPQPHLMVTGRRLDALAPPLNVSGATNAFAADIGSAMLVGVDFPTLGCWEITGRYAGAELSFVVRVAP